MKYYFKSKSKKYLLATILLLSLCPLLGLTYSSFIFSSNNYRASEMYIGSLLYSIKINEESTSNISVSPGETEINIEITSLNTVSTFYKLMYENNENIEVKYNKNIGDLPKDLISNTKTIKIQIKNKSNEDITVNFEVAAGYNTNNLEDVKIPEGYTEITEFYIVNDLNFMAMTIDGENAEMLDSTKSYHLENYTCTNGEKIEYNNETKQIIVNGGINNIPINCNLDFLTIDSSFKTLAEKIYEDNTKLESRTDFSSAFTEDTTGNIYYTSENTESVCDSSNELTYVSGSEETTECKTYYFAGKTSNNFVSFGGFIWRIVRINEDQSVRLIYQGIKNVYPFTNYDGMIAIGPFAPTHALYDVQYVGYMHSIDSTLNQNTMTYEEATQNNMDSLIKRQIDIWYRANLYKNYNSYISSTAIYCNDRSIHSGLGYGNNTTYYGAYDRLFNQNKPQFKCPLDNDKFTVSSSTGNSKLIYGVATITADESAYAGAYQGVELTANSNYIIENARSMSTYTMTPIRHIANSSSLVSRIHTKTNTPVNAAFGIRPVLSLKSCVKYTKGTGTQTDPYEVAIEETCKSLEN